MRNISPKFERGFTLVEAVLVIVITGIIAAVVATFIRLPVQGYVDSQARADLTDVADTALRRMARELRLALPNSIRVANAGGIQYIEFLLTRTGGRYLSAEDNPVAGNVLSFDPNNPNLLFDAIGPMPAGAQAIAAGDFIVVYNLGPGMAPADAYNCAVACNLAEVAQAPVAGANSYTIRLVNNPFAAQAPVSLSSPARRFQVVQTPVTYACNPATGTLTRHWGYAIQANQPINPTAAPLAGSPNALLATGVTACAFSYNAVSERSGMVALSLTMSAAGGESGAVTLFHQVHVNNAP